MPVWRPVAEERAGYLFNLSDAMAIVERRVPNLLVPVTEGMMTLVSDYSGQHKQATHEAYSFLVTTSIALEEWLPKCADFRAKWLSDGRRLSFKRLNEPVRRRALLPFLQTASSLRGNLLTIMVDRRVGSFLGDPGVAVEAFPDCFSPGMNHGTVEKMLRIAGFVALIIAGLRRQDQESFWISDHDEALDSHERREQFGRLASYLTFGLTGWKKPADQWFGTTETAGAPEWAEDAAAIPDLVAGAYCQLSAILPFRFSEALPRVVVSARVDSERALAIGDWLAGPHDGLHPVLLRLEVDSNKVVRATAQVIEGRIRSL